MTASPDTLAAGAAAAAALDYWTATGEVPAGVSDKTLYRWRARVRGCPRHEWAELLAPRYRGRTATSEIPGPAWDTYCGLYLSLLAPAATECHRRVCDAARRQGWGTMPSLDTFKRRLAAEYAPEEVILAREGEEALDKLYPAQRRTVVEYAPLQILNADGLMLNTFVKWEDGSIGRPHIWTWQDFATRLPLAWQVDRSENTCQIRRAFGAVLDEYGIYAGPDGPHIIIDNTRAAANKTMTGGTRHRHRFAFAEGEAKGILTQFGYTIHWTSVERWGGRGQAKPVERLHREMLEKICKAPECAGAYTGPHTQAKPEDYGKTAVPIELFRRVVEREMERIRTQADRRTELGGGSKSLIEVFRSGYAAAQAAGHIRPVAEAERRIFTLAQVTLRVRSTAEVHLHRNRYWSKELVAYRGKDIVLRHDPDQLRADQWAYTLDGTLIGPVTCIADTGALDADAARQHNRARRDLLKATRAALDAKRRLAHPAPHLPVIDTETDAPIPIHRDAAGSARKTSADRVAERMAKAAARAG